jgi:hypothetical protein
MIIAVALSRGTLPVTPGVRLFVEMGRCFDADVLDGRRVTYSGDRGTLEWLRNGLKALDGSHQDA